MKGKLTGILHSFHGVSLDELSRAPLMNRVDEKFAFPFSRLEHYLEVLKNDYDVLNIDGKVIFNYSSLYFDNTDFQFFKDHHQAIPNRFKVRIRTYLDSNVSFLEVKEKVKGRTNKNRINIDGFTNDLSENHQSFLKNQLRKNLHLKPVLINNYCRITLVNKHKEERLTIDFDIVNNAIDESNSKQSLSNIVIAELKQPKLDRTSPFYQLMKKEIIRPFRISKFCFGMIDLYESPLLKSNRFKEKRILIQKLLKNTLHASLSTPRL